MKFNIVILGAGDHGRVVFDILESEKRNYTVVGFIDIMNNPEIWGKHHCSRPIFGGPDKLAELMKRDVQYAIVAKGGNAERREFTDLIERMGFTIPSAVHPLAAVSKNAYVGNIKSLIISDEKGAGRLKDFFQFRNSCNLFRFWHDYAPSRYFFNAADRSPWSSFIPGLIVEQIDADSR